MVTRQQRDAGRLGRLDEPGGSLDGVADRLLHEDRHPRRDALQAAVHMELIGRGEDDSVRPVPLEQLGQRRVQRDTECVGHLRGGGSGVDDPGELRRLAGIDLLDVPPADESGAGHRDADGHVRSRAWSAGTAR
jgi:hypothetical protein